MEYLNEWMVIATVHLLAVMSPGPDTAVVVKNSLKSGQRAGLITALGIGCGIGVHVLYSALGMGFLLQRYFWLQPLITLMGALYLGYLGLYGFFNRGTELDADFDVEQGGRTPSPFVSGFLTNGLNPKATLFFIALFSSVIAQTTPVGVRLGYGVYLMFATFLWFALLAALVGHPRIRVRLEPYIARADLLMSLLLTLLSAYLLWGLLDSLF